MSLTEIALIVTVIVVVIALVIWRAARRRNCQQCGRPVLPGQIMCPFCHSPLHHRSTAFEAVPTGRLAFVAGPRAGNELEFRGRELSIGRAPESDIRLDDELVSWQHAILTYEDGQYMLFDQDSTNGTWVNGHRIAQSAIRPGADQIRIGPSVFVLRVGDEPFPTPAPLPMTTPPKAPVETVYEFGNYRRVETLGTGGAATVYRAISRRGGEEVAIKVLHRSDPYLRDKFRKEGQEIARLLRHPHIVRVYGGGESHDVLYLVMEFMDGGTLRERLSPGRPMLTGQVISIAGQVCDALRYAHKTGIYHRDIKPENIFFSSKGKVKLGDFGIARIAQSVTRTQSGWLIGTPDYMSYEQAKGRPIDGRSDLYSLGVVLYEMVTGRCPFVAESPLAVVDKHIKEDPVPPSLVNRDVPARMDKVIMRALHKDRQRRFRTAGELARALGYTRPMHDGETAQASSCPRPRSVADPGRLRLSRGDGVTIRLGRDSTPLNRRDINPSDREISRQHARVLRRGGNYWIEDMKSSNGTYLNGLRIFRPQVLRPGDRIRLGRTVLRVEG